MESKAEWIFSNTLVYEKKLKLLGQMVNHTTYDELGQQQQQQTYDDRHCCSYVWGHILYWSCVYIASNNSLVMIVETNMQKPLLFF